MNVLCGDINIDLIKQNIGKSYIDMIISSSLEQHIPLPVRTARSTRGYGTKGKLSKLKTTINQEETNYSEVTSSPFLLIAFI